MKNAPATHYLKAALLLVCLPLLSGCSFFGATFIRNLTNGPVAVQVKLAWEPTQSYLFHSASYLPVLLSPEWRNARRMTDSLPVTVTATTIAFRLPARSIVLVDAGLNRLGNLESLRLQLADSSVQVLDSTQLARAIQVRMLGGPRAWYDIKREAN